MKNKIKSYIRNKKYNKLSSYAIKIENKI